MRAGDGLGNGAEGGKDLPVIGKAAAKDGDLELLAFVQALDDATGELLACARFVAQECTAGYLGVLKAIAATKGLPWSAYMDHHSSLFRNDDHWSAQERGRGVQAPTQVGRPWRRWGL